MKKTYTTQEITFLVNFRKALELNSLNGIEPFVEKLWKQNDSEFLTRLWKKIIDWSNNHIWYNPLLEKDCVYIGDIEKCKIPFENFIKDNKLEEVLENASMTLGDRMKSYEKTHQVFLNPNLDTVLRLDGRGFSKWTKQFEFPFDDKFIDMMNVASIELAKEISGFKLIFAQSDEISILIEKTDFEKSEMWFSGRTDKILSTCAGIFSGVLNREYMKYKIQNMQNSLKAGEELYIDDEFFDFKVPSVDCRVFQLPNLDEVKNAFLFRQRDCEKNAISMYAQSMFPHKQLLKKNGTEKIEMMLEKGFDYTNSNPLYKFGRFISKHQINKGTEEKPIIRTEFKIESFKMSDEKERFDKFFEN